MSHGSPVHVDDWSWKHELLGLLRVRRPHPSWIRTSALVLLITAGIIALCTWLGLRNYRDPSHYFGERTLGTYASAGLLVAAAVVCFKIRARNPAAEVARFWLWWGVLLCIIAGDDLFRLHEEIDRTFHRLFGLNPNNRITDHLDDALVAAYVIPAGMLWFRYRKHLIRMHRMIQTLALAFVAFVVMSAMDFTMNNKAIEDSIKLVAEALILCSMLAAYYSPGTLTEQSLTNPAFPAKRE